MDYPFMETPFVLKPFDQMSKEQVKQYFNWFMEIKEQRITQLENYIKREIPMFSLDYNPESFIPLWEWFENHISWEDKTDEEINIGLIGKEEWMKPIIKASTKKMTLLTISLGMDISTYFGETMIRNHSGIHWGYKMKPKTLDGVNQPVLLGFRKYTAVYPFGLIEVCIRRSTKKPNKEKLYETYKIWEKNI